LALIIFGVYFAQIFKPFILSGNSIGFLNSLFFNILFVGSALVFIVKRHYPPELLSLIVFPISKRKLSMVIVINSIINFLNLVLVLFFIPFFLTYVVPNVNLINGTIYLFGVFILFVISSLIVLLFKNLYRLSTYNIVLIFSIIAAALIFNSQFNKVINESLTLLFDGRLTPLIIYLLITLGLILLNYFFLGRLYYHLSSSYIENYSNKSISVKFFKNFRNHYLLLELRLIIRNKRLIGFSIMAFILLFLFYFVMKKEEIGIFDGFILYTLISGTFGYIYSQYTFSWESSYFPFIMARNFNLRKYLEAKYLLYVASSTIIFIVFLSTSNNLLRTNILLSATIYNISLGYFLFFLSATTNNAKIDLEGNILFNMQGFNPVQMIALIFIIAAPCLFLFLVTLIIDEVYSLLIFDAICLLSIYFIHKWIDLINDQVIIKKYKMLESF